MTAKILLSVLRRGLVALALAAGGIGPATAAGDGRTSFTIDSPARRLEITTLCRGPNAVFTVRNKRLQASEMGRFTVLGGDGETVISSRRLRLSSGQSIRFSVSTEQLERFGGHAIFRVAMVEVHAATVETSLVCV